MREPRQPRFLRAGQPLGDSALAGKCAYFSRERHAGRWNFPSGTWWSTAPPSPRRSRARAFLRAFAPRRTESSTWGFCMGRSSRRRRAMTPLPGRRLLTAALPIWPWATSTSGPSRRTGAKRCAPGRAARRGGALTNWGKKAFTRGAFFLTAPCRCPLCPLPAGAMKA